MQAIGRELELKGPAQLNPQDCVHACCCGNLLEMRYQVEPRARERGSGFFRPFDSAFVAEVGCSAKADQVHSKSRLPQYCVIRF
jgi:hypothetical protein